MPAIFTTITQFLSPACWRLGGAAGTWLVCLTVALVTISGPVSGQLADGVRVIRVYPQAGDAGPGAAGPATGTANDVGTLAEAVLQAGRLRQANGGHDAIIIELQPGIHRLREPVRLTDRDSGTAQSPLIIRSSASGPAIIRGSVPVLAGTPTTTELARVPAASRPHLKAYDLPAVAAAAPRIDLPRRHDMQPGPVPFEVFDVQGALRPARWPKTGWANGHADLATGVTFATDAARMASWRNEPDLWVSGYFKWDWAYETRPVAAVSSSAGELSLERPPQYGFGPSFRMAVHHAAGNLDAPGEWVRLADHRRLIAWPRDQTGVVEISIAEQLIAIEGARHIRIEGLTFERVRGDAIIVGNSQSVSLSGCTIRWTGGRAVTVDGGAGNSVDGGLIEDTGEGGVRLSGGNRERLEASGHSVTGAIIRRFSRLGQTYRPAVSLEGVGNRAEGNAISDGPHIAIFFSGNDHVISLNEIAGVVADTSDAGAIYTGRDWTAQGTLIKHNFIHDVRGRGTFDVKGVYLDDLASGITVDANLFLRVDQPVFIGGGRDNKITNNVFVASQPAIHIDGRGRTWAAGSLTDPASEINAAFAAIPANSLAWIERYPRLFTYLSDDPADPKRNRAQGNRVLGGEVYRLLPEVKVGLQTLEPAAAARPIAQTGSKAAHAITAAGIEPAIRAAFGPRTGADLPFARMDRAAILAGGAQAGK
jgi:Right handed beta helix region